MKHQSADATVSALHSHRRIRSTSSPLPRTIRPLAAWIRRVLGTGLIAGVLFNPFATEAAIAFGGGPDSVDSVYIVIEHENFGPSPFVYEYRFTSQAYTTPVEGPSDFAGLLTGYNLMAALVAAPIQTPGGGQHQWAVDNLAFIEEFTLTIDGGEPVTVTAIWDPPDTSESWVQWASGAYYSYTSWDTGDVIWGEHPSGTWEQGLGTEGTFLLPGGAIGWTMGEYDDDWNLTADAPAAIPEPAGVLLMAVGGGLFGLARKRRLRN